MKRFSAYTLQMGVALDIHIVYMNAAHKREALLIGEHYFGNQPLLIRAAVVFSAAEKTQMQQLFTEKKRGYCVFHLGTELKIYDFVVYRTRQEKILEVLGK